MKKRGCAECTKRGSVRILSPVEKVVCYECYNTERKVQPIKAEVLYKQHR